MTEYDDIDPESDAPKDIPNEQSEEIRGMVPSFKVVDKLKYFDLIKYQPHGKQWLFHKSNARFKIVCAGRRAGKTILTAKNVQPQLLIPNKRVWAVGPSYCTDIETEILTKRGWLKYDQIIDGDETLTLNNKGMSEWQYIDSVHTFDSQHDMISMEWRGHSSMTTPNHRWLVGYTTNNSTLGKETLGYRFTTTENLTKSNEYVLCAAPVINLPTEQKYTDAFVELVAWYWIEGCDQASGNGIIIAQNRGRNSNRIASALISLFGPPSNSHIMQNMYDTTPRWSDWKTVDGLNKCGNFGLNSHAGVLFRDVAPDKIVSSEFISSLTKSQLELFINISVIADGHSRERERVVVQRRKDRLGQLQMACQLAGYQTSLSYQQSRDMYWLAIFESNEIWPGQRTQKLKHKKVNHNGVVWCPKTANGTWLARRNGTVYFTGNTLGEKEFRVVWEDMIVRLGFGRDKRVKKAFSIKSGNMFIEFPWNTRFEVRSAERPDYLVGDSLDHVIMSEAAIHNDETWTRYIQPALSDKRGSADFPSCIVEDTLIATEDGIIEIGDIDKCREPKTYIPYEKMVAGFAGPLEKATKFYVNGFNPTIKVTNGIGSILEGTENHPVWCMRNGFAQWIELKDLKIGDWLATRVGADLWGNNDDVSDFVPNVSNKAYDFDTTLTPKLMYLIGYIIGNGYIDFKNYRVSVSTAEPIIKEFLKSFGFKHYSSEDNKYGWIIGRKVFVQFLEYLGFTHVKGPNKFIPKRLMKCSKELIGYLLSGLFDADGSAHKDRNVVKLNSTSRKLIDQVQFLLLNFGIIGHIGNTKSLPTKKVKVTTYGYALEINGNNAKLFHEEIGFQLKRKQRKIEFKQNRLYGIPMQNERIKKLYGKYSAGRGKGKDNSRLGSRFTKNFHYMLSNTFNGYTKLNDFLNALEPYAYDDSDWQYLKELSTEKYYWSQVKKLESSENFTYDLVIPTTHAFVSNSFISHNTPRGYNWFHKFWQYGQNPHRDYEAFDSWRYPSWSNHIVYPGGRDDPEILLLERTLPKDEFEQEIAADFTSFSGKIYSEFDEQTHVRKCTYNPQWKNFIAFDFGYVNPLAAIEFQIDPMDRVHVWREHYKSRIILEDHLHIMKNREQPEHYKIDLTFGDAASPESIAVINRDFAPCWGDPKSKDDWMEGVRLVKQFLKLQEVGVLDEYDTPKMEPWLFIDHSCENTIREFNNYRSAPKTNSRNEKNLRESAQSFDDHALDALRYGMMHIFKLGANVSITTTIPEGTLKKGIPDAGFFSAGNSGGFFQTTGTGLYVPGKKF